MKAILFFVAAGIVLDRHREAAVKIAETTGKRVVFRNGSSAEISGERPEPNDGVAGKVPAPYACFPAYDDAGTLTSPGTGPTIPKAPRKLNALGLPQGAPSNREELKACLEGEGVEFHGNAKVDKLLDLYRAHFAEQLAAE